MIGRYEEQSLWSADMRSLSLPFISVISGRHNHHHRRPRAPLRVRLWEVMATVLPAAFYAYGGPASIAIFEDKFVRQREWVTQEVSS